MFTAPSPSFAVTSPDFVFVKIKEAQREQQGCFVEQWSAVINQVRTYYKLLTMSLKCSCLISPSIHFLLPTGEGDIFISDIYKFLLGAETMSCATASALSKNTAGVFIYSILITPCRPPKSLHCECDQLCVMTNKHHTIKWKAASEGDGGVLSFFLSHFIHNTGLTLQIYQHVRPPNCQNQAAVIKYNLVYRLAETSLVVGGFLLGVQRFTNMNQKYFFNIRDVSTSMCSLALI